MTNCNILFIIVAAGSGSRFGHDLPKQFHLLGGRPVLMTTIDRVREALPYSDILLVLSREHEHLWQSLCEQYSFESPAVVYGGDTRWQSVSNALQVITDFDDDDIVMIHDGARPLLHESVVTDLRLEIQSGADGAIPAVPVTDSLRVITPEGGSESVFRSDFRAVQTPQAFPLRLLMHAYSLPYSPLMTDDASVMEAAGFGDIRLVEGSPDTLKITRPSDLAAAEYILSHSFES